MKPYADTNFIVPLYLEVPHTRAAEEIYLQGKEQLLKALPMTDLLWSEVVNIF